MLSLTKASRGACTPTPFPALESVSKPVVGTAAAAFYLDRKQQTLRSWAIAADAPLRPLRINGRLAWSVSELKKVLGVSA